MTIKYDVRPPTNEEIAAAKARGEVAGESARTIPPVYIYIFLGILGYWLFVK